MPHPWADGEMMKDATNSWATYDPEDAFAGTSLKKRAEKRTVQQVGDRQWIVHGDPKLGDGYPSYQIDLREGERKYVCSCYSHGQGETRRRKMCSHVLAVILHRKKGDNGWVADTEDEYVDVEVRVANYHNTEPSEPDKISDGEPRAARRRGDGAGVDGAEDRSVSNLGGVEWDDEDSWDADNPLDIGSIELGSPPLPDKFTEYRPNQWKAVVEILDHFEDGKKVVMLSAPTGAGKSLIAETVRRLRDGRSVYSCTTKTLQDQIQREFSYARTIKGKANYSTQLRSDLTADDCTGTSNNGYSCQWCEGRELCPYRIAKSDAAVAPLPILNIAYFLAETMHQKSSMFHGRELVIIDEADTLEQQLMSNIEVVIGSGLRKQLGIKSLPKKTVVNDWVRWLGEEIIPAIDRLKVSLRSQSHTLFGEGVKEKRQINRMNQLSDRIKSLIKIDEDGDRRIDAGWVMTGHEGKVKDPTIKFKPVRVDEHAREVLWNRGKQFLLMSATLISPPQMAKDLGLEDDEWSVVTMESTFPVEQRPVFVRSIAPMTNKAKDESWPKMAVAIENLINDNPNVRILVHTVSYHLTQYLHDNIESGRTMMYQAARDRERVLSQFLDVDDAVLLAPSFDRGVDLPTEDCQVIVIAKVPYPYLGDKQVSARLYSKGGQAWYSVQTIRAIVQMTGRGMRSHDDWCDSYVLDSSFKRLYRENKHLFPKWWRDSLVLSVNDPKNRKLIDAAKERRESR